MNSCVSSIYQCVSSNMNIKEFGFLNYQFEIYTEYDNEKLFSWQEYYESISIKAELQFSCIC